MTTAEAQGPVTATREGATMRLDNRLMGENAFRFGEREDRSWRRLRHAFANNETITVRVNPELPVELSVAAGSAQVTGLRGGLTFRVDAGSLRAFDGAGSVDGRIASGSAQLDWLVRDGRPPCAPSSAPQGPPAPRLRRRRLGPIRARVGRPRRRDRAARTGARAGDRRIGPRHPRHRRRPRHGQGAGPVTPSDTTPAGPAATPTAPHATARSAASDW